MLALLLVSTWIAGAEPAPAPPPAPVSASTAPGAAWSAPKSAMVLDGVPLSPGVSPRMAAKASELLAHDLAAGGLSVWTHEQVETLRTGASTAAAPDLTAARHQLDEGKRLYLEVQFEAAAAQLNLARQAFVAALPTTGDFGPLQEALTYLAAAEQGLGHSAKVDEAFGELLRFRPTDELDARTFPPDLVNAFTARQAAMARGPHATLSIASAPPLATVTVDGQRRGETPLELGDLVPGQHVVRIDAAGYRPETRQVEVTVPRAQVEVHLEPSHAGDELRALEQEAQGPGQRTLLTRQATALCQAAGVGAVVLVGVAQVADGLLLTAAMVDAQGAVRIAWTKTDADLLGAAEASRQLVRTLLTQAGPGYAGTGAAPAVTLNFTGRLLGDLPAPTAAPPPEAEATSAPFYERWYFWAGVVVVGAGAAAGTYAIVHHNGTTTQLPDTTTLDVQVQP